jgi:hypothetical protein
MWNDINIKDDHVTRSAGTALLCSILTQHLSDRRPELQPLSETLCWIILPIVFKVAAARKDGKYGQEKEDAIGWNALKRPTASPRSLWIVSFCLVIYWVFAAENALVAFIPALTPLLLVSQNHLLWHDSELPSASPPVSQVFFYLSNTVWGGVLVAFCSILALKSDWQIRASDALLIVPVASLLVSYLTLDPRPRMSNKCYRFLPPFDFEDALTPLSLRVTFLLVIALGLETLAFGFPVCSVYTPALALTKALTWYFTIQTVRRALRSLYILLILTCI